MESTVHYKIRNIEGYVMMQYSSDRSIFNILLDKALVATYVFRSKDSFGFTSTGYI